MGKERQEQVHQERETLFEQGSLYVPEAEKDPNFRYAWIADDPRTPFRMETRLKDGYSPVQKSEFRSLGEDLRKKYGLPSCGNGNSVGDLISYTGKDKITQYLMKITHENYAKIAKRREQAVDRTEESIGSDLKQLSEGYDHEVKINNNHIFKINTKQHSDKH